jgi:hypothetical protein
MLHIVKTACRASADQLPKCSGLLRNASERYRLWGLADQIPNFSEEVLHPKYVIAIDIDGAEGLGGARGGNEGAEGGEAGGVAAAIIGDPTTEVVIGTQPQLSAPGALERSPGDHADAGSKARDVMMTDKDGRKFKCSVPLAPVLEWDATGSAIQVGLGSIPASSVFSSKATFLR